jgi:hypothetical protein
MGWGSKGGKSLLAVSKRFNAKAQRRKDAKELNTETQRHSELLLLLLFVVVVVVVVVERKGLRQRQKLTSEQQRVRATEVFYRW